MLQFIPREEQLHGNVIAQVTKQMSLNEQFIFQKK